ncbi:MAG: ATP-dependent chaperone ClpB, partial [Planctomycetes bacterium]|nr:ATP-dependent chaperone ClpB [Planctomycetota bacterium]
MAFRFDKLTVKAQEAVQRAHGLAQDLGNPQLLPLHLLAALVREDQGLVKPLLQKIGTNLKQFDSIIDGELKRLPKVSGAGGDVGMSPATQKVLDAAQDASAKMKDQFVSTEHLLLALTQVDDQAKRLLEMHGVEEADVLTALKGVRGG